MISLGTPSGRNTQRFWRERTDLALCSSGILNHAGLPESPPTSGDSSIPGPKNTVRRTGVGYRQTKEGCVGAAYLVLLKQNTFKKKNMLEHDFFGSFQNRGPIFIKELFILCWRSHF